MDTNTAEQTDGLVDVDALNRLNLSDIFIATGPAKIVAEEVTVGPVRVWDKPDEVWFLVRIDGYADVLKPTEAEALAAADPQIRRHVARLEGRRVRALAETKRIEGVATRIAACSGHEFVEHEISRCLRRVTCRRCGFVATSDSSG